MDATPFLIATRVLVAALCGLAIAALLVRAAGRGRPRRELLPILTLAVLLLGAGGGMAFGQLPLVGQLSFVLFPLLLATFPDGGFVPRWTLWLAIAWVPLTAAIVILGDTLVGRPWWWAVPSLSGLALLGAQLYRYVRRSTTLEREATRWAILGVGTSMVFFLVLGFFGEIGTAGTAAEAWANLAGIPFLIGPAIGLVRPRLWNVDAAFRFFLAAVAAALPLAVVFAGVGALATALGASPVAAGWWGAAAVAASAYPTIRFALRLATIIVFRGRGDPDLAVARLGERLDDLPEPQAVSQTVARAVADALRTDRVELHGESVAVASTGSATGSASATGGGSATGSASATGAGSATGTGQATDTGPTPVPEPVEGPGPENFPIAFHGEVLATLVVWPRPGEPALTPHDRVIVTRLALHAAPALHGARALVDLTAVHARLLLAREEERRRLRRDLHDDLSPTLSGLGLSAAALARRAAALDPALAETARDLVADINDAVDQTREIAYGLRPPILDDRGLVAAIRDRVHGQSADRMRVDVVAPAEPLALPAAVDLAALRIVQEAVANVRRHAEATRCTVVIERTPGELRVSVDDDGRGIPSHVRPGIGLTSIRERAGELGGSVQIGRSAEGGVRVAVRLPFDEPRLLVEEVA